jgi:AcrR family transcriptional regulator
MSSDPAGPTRRVGRPRTGETGLTRSAILTAALDLVDAEGLGALTMRRLARELAVDPMSIYHHLPNKAAIVSGLVQLVFAGMRVPDRADGGWADRVRAWAAAYRDMVRAHPNLVLQIVTDAAAVSEAAALIDGPLRDALTEAGLPDDVVEHAAGLLVDYLNGHALAGAAAGTSGFDVNLDIIIAGVRGYGGRRA